jgi:hypothetical protein
VSRELEGVSSTPGGAKGLPVKSKEIFVIAEKGSFSQLSTKTAKFQYFQVFSLNFGRKFSKFFWFTHKLDIVPKIPEKRPLHKSFLSA